MSSMVRPAFLAIALGSMAAVSLPACAQEASDWDTARANLVAEGPGPMAAEIARWQDLYADRSAQLPFERYSSFLLANPGFPDETALRARAEERLRREFVPNGVLLDFFERYPPVTNFSKAHYALALMGRDRETAAALAREAWRGGEMSEVSEATIGSMFGANFTQDDHDARMDALLWQREGDDAARQIERTSPGKRAVFAARLAILQGGDGATSDPAAQTDPGYLYNRSRELRQEGRRGEAIAMLANRAPLASKPFDATAWVEELLAVARLGSARDAQMIAARIDDAFAPGEDISQRAYKLRDDYTSLMWLGGTSALWERGDALGAAPIFYRYGAAARTPQTRSKGFYWAGYAAQRGGDAAEANRYYEMAAEYGDRFYGQLALEALGRDLPALAGQPTATPTPEQRAAFIAAPLTQAVAEVARDAPWSTGIRFYRAIADQAETEAEHVLVADLAREIGRRDLAVNLAEAAMADGHTGFTQIGYPRLQTPPGTNWTMIHALARQESQFAENAISHAGARGLMQFMPATAQEESRRANMSYSPSRLIEDPTYSMQLGSNHIERLISYYDGSYPLAIAAYNAGPGNVNRWLRENGDPRRGGISWTEWIEKIGFFETKNYVQRVIENAVVYEHLYPEQAVRQRKVSDFLR
ncbi:lytic transglycosylase domain-containing protein [Alteraurantiacibacter aquimixticola]|uniref:Lytic transglycosylase domain-containing protein n=1 Tax=Alteraurantiacibacter aquimixticola TaxID=2489173 RepID=A0A4T3F676_9SPHN|nr:lytic transglycosylase domain-containing protein [Alteraurantiacibacter aquimixticola]TIX50356.1 lytic transglycosylase domain-containing protein [Alteraurantiacibacter aquimixticola]